MTTELRAGLRRTAIVSSLLLLAACGGSAPVQRPDVPASPGGGGATTATRPGEPSVPAAPTLAVLPSDRPEPSLGGVATPALPSPALPTSAATAPALPTAAPSDPVPSGRPGPRRSDHPEPSAPVPSVAPSLPATPSTIPTAIPTIPTTTSKTHYEVPAADLALDLPAGWLGFDAEAMSDSELFAQLVASIPQLEAALDGLASSAVAFFGVDTDVSGGAESVGTNVVIIDLGPATPIPALDALGRATAATIEEALDVQGEVGQSRVTLPGGEAVKLTFTYTATADGATLMLYSEEYLLVMGDHTYSITFTAQAAIAGDQKSVFTTIAKSLRSI